MLNLIKLNEFEHISRPTIQQVKLAASFVKGRVNESDSKLLISWDVYNNRIKINKITDQIRNSPVEYARTLFWEVDIDNESSIEKNIMMSIDNKISELLSYDVISGRSDDIEDKLLDLFSGKNIGFYELYPIISWPEDTYNKYYQQFKELV